MSSRKSSSQNSTASSSPPPQLPPRSLIASKVPVTENESKLLESLNQTYTGVKKITRVYDRDGNPMSQIQIDFTSEQVVLKILDKARITIAGKLYPVRGYWPPVCYRCHEEGHLAFECPERSVPEWRLAELLEEQRSHFESMINEFEDRWNKRLATIPTVSSKPNIDQLNPIFKDLTTVCNQFNQQNAQIQKQLSTLAVRVQNIQTESKN